MFVGNSELSKSEVPKFKVPISVQQNVFWLQVSVNDVSLMKRLQSADDFSCQKLNLLLCKGCVLFQMLKEFPSFHEIHYQIEFVLCLESVMNFDQERTEVLLQNKPFCLGVLYLMSLKQIQFFKHLHRIEFLSSYFLNKQNFSKRALTKKTQNFKAVQPYIYGFHSRFRCYLCPRTRN